MSEEETIKINLRVKKEKKKPDSLITDDHVGMDF
jgi:hypothetical protein